MGNTSSNRTTFGFCHDSLNSLKCRFLFPFSFSAWHEFVDQGLEQWLGFHKFWLRVDIPIQIIHYDHLLADMKQELTSLSKFLDFRVNDTILQCTLRRSDGQFHRQRRKLPFDLFTNLERIKATEYVLEVNNLIYQINNTSRWHTDRYSSFFTQIISWLPDMQQNRPLVDRTMESKRRKARTGVEV